MKYKFLVFGREDTLEYIAQVLTDSKWEPVSYSHSYTGMTVLMRHPTQLSKPRKDNL